MAYELVQEVLDNVPDKLGPSERLALVIIAEMCRRGSRTIDIPQEVFLTRMGLGERGIRKVFWRLEEAGFHVRVPFGTLRDGRPKYAMSGQPCRYTLPPLKPAETSTEQGGTEGPPPNGGGTVGTNQGTVGTNQGTVGTNQGTTVPPNQSGETFGLSPDHSELPAANAPNPPSRPSYDRQALISQLEAARAKKKGRLRKPDDPDSPFTKLMTIDAKEPKETLADG